MTPCFRTDILEEILPTLLASSSGWGIDQVWFNMLEGRGEQFAIVAPTLPSNDTAAIDAYATRVSALASVG